MRRPKTLRPMLTAALLSPLAATCTPHNSMLAEAHQQAVKSGEEVLVGFLIEGKPLPAQGG